MTPLPPRKTRNRLSCRASVTPALSRAERARRSARGAVSEHLKIISTSSPRNPRVRSRVARERPWPDLAIASPGLGAGTERQAVGRDGALARTCWAGRGHAPQPGGKTRAAELDVDVIAPSGYSSPPRGHSARAPPDDVARGRLARFPHPPACSRRERAKRVAAGALSQDCCDPSRPTRWCGMTPRHPIAEDAHPALSGTGWAEGSVHGRRPKGRASNPSRARSSVG